MPPGGNFDLSHWKLQLPTPGGVLTCTAGSVDETNSSPSGGWLHQCIFLHRYGWRDGVLGAEQRSDNERLHDPRSELREYINPTNAS